MERIDTNEVKSLSTLGNDANSANEIALEMMMQKPSNTEEDDVDSETANEKQLEMKIQKSTDTQEDIDDNEIEPDRISNCDATQVFTIENEEVLLEERKSPTFIDTENDSSTPNGKCFQVI